MAVPYTRRLATGYFSSGGSQTLLRPYASEHLVLRDIIVANLAAAAADFYVTMSVPGVGNVRILTAAQLAPQHMEHLELRQTWEIGEALTFYVGAVPASIIVTGYVLAA